MKIKYQIKDTLSSRGPINQLQDVPVDGTLLVGDVAIGSWEEGHSSAGCDTVKIFPAFYNGERAFLKTYCWWSAPPYNCSGLRRDVIFTFEEGVRELLEHNAFEHLWEVKDI